MTPRDTASLVIVLAAAAVSLRGLDLLPQLLGEPAGGRPFAAIAQVERRLGERVALPAYFPSTLPWPPSRIRVGGQRPAAVVISFGDQAVLGQTIGGASEIPARLWPSGVVLESAETGQGTLGRVLGEDGRVFSELRWQRWDRQFALRFSGSADELVRIARSMRRQP
jgi:hypothetical protein